jgi:hypothetical protein
MNLLPTLIGFLLIGLSGAKPRVRISDMELLTGDQWTGTLSYLDYSSGKRNTIKANLLVAPLPSNGLSWIFRNEYPGEPHANENDTLVIGKKGKLLNGAHVTGRRLSKDTVIVTTEKTSIEDEGKIKQFRYTYRIHPLQFSITKEEKYGSTPYFERNTYAYKRGQ